MNNKFKYLVHALALVSLCIAATSVNAAELQLAGIRLGRPATTIIQKYGNPDEVRIGTGTQTTTAMPGAAAMPGGMPGASTMPGGMPGMPTMPGGMPGMATMPGGMPGMPTMPGGMPGMPTMPGGMPGMPTMPGMPGMPGMPTAPGATGASQTKTVTEVTWVYNFSNGRMLEFVINSQGRILQIAAYGTSWPGLSTSKGIKLGNTYKDIIKKYGWPQQHENKGLELVVKYPDTHRVLFTIVDQTIVGITIALMD